MQTGQQDSEHHARHEDPVSQPERRRAIKVEARRCERQATRVHQADLSQEYAKSNQRQARNKKTAPGEQRAHREGAKSIILENGNAFDQLTRTPMQSIAISRAAILEPGDVRVSWSGGLRGEGALLAYNSMILYTMHSFTICYL